MARGAPMSVGSSSLRFRVDWQRASGVVTPELSATACALDIEVNGRSLTLLQDSRGGGLRRAINVSAYPLAEWFATNWWGLNEHVRPSAISSDYWGWRHIDSQPWLRRHNFR